MNKWGILLYDIGISGGANVIFNHALYACNQGVDITFVSRQKKTCSDASWHIGTERFMYKTIEEAKDEIYDVVIATEWRTAYDIYQLKAEKYVYFVQSVESRFFHNPACFLGYIADNTYHLPFKYITEVGWIKKILYEHYSKEAEIVLNGIDKDIFKVDGKCVEEKSEDHVRFLIEGSVHNWLKNVATTVRLCEEAGAEEIWLVTPDNISSYEGVDRVFSQVPMSSMPQIYRSCDVLVKLSLVEGMFGPPLEMFHCGGTAITYDIEGSDEYIKNGYNALVVKKNDEEGVIKAIKQLINNPDMLNYLKVNAVKTASMWCDWNKSSACFYRHIQKAKSTDYFDVQRIKKNGSAGANIYRRVEKYIGNYPGNNRIESLVESYLSSKRDIYIYGAGSLCKSTIILLSEFDIPISGIIVSNKETNPNTVIGHRVYGIDELKISPNSVMIYISTEKYYREIYELLKKKGYSNII